MKKQNPNSTSHNIGLGILALGILVVLISMSKISSIDKEQDIYGLGDAASISCDQGAFLDDFFATNNTDPNCEDSSGEDARRELYGKLPMYEKMRLAGFVIVGTGALLVFTSFVLKRRNLNQAKTSNQITPSTSERIAELEVLKQKGLLSETEYEGQRRRILDDL